MRRTTRAEEARNWLAERQNEAIAEFTLLVSTVAMVAAIVAMIAPAQRRTSRTWLLLSLVQSFFGNQIRIGAALCLHTTLARRPVRGREGPLVESTHRQRFGRALENLRVAGLVIGNEGQTRYVQSDSLPVFSSTLPS